MTRTIEKQGYNRAEAAKFLGVAQNTLMKLINEGRIGFIQVGRRKIFPKTSLEAFLKEA